MHVEDLEEFENDDIDNVVQNLRRPQDIWHPTIHAHAGSTEIATAVLQYRLCHFKLRLPHVTKLTLRTRNKLLWFMEHYY